VTWRPRNGKVADLLLHAGKQQLLFRHMSLPILPSIASSFFLAAVKRHFSGLYMLEGTSGMKARKRESY